MNGRPRPTGSQKPGNRDVNEQTVARCLENVENIDRAKVMAAELFIQINQLVSRLLNIQRIQFHVALE